MSALGDLGGPGGCDDRRRSRWVAARVSDWSWRRGLAQHGAGYANYAPVDETTERVRG